MTIDSTALATAVVLALIAELEGNAASETAATDPTSFRSATKRTVAGETAAATKFSEIARKAASEIGKPTDKEAGFRAFRTVSEPSAEAGLHVENVRTIAVLDAAAYASEVAIVTKAQECAEQALADALAALDLDDKAARELIIRAIAAPPGSASQH